MKITLALSDSRHDATLPYDGAAHVTVAVPCPHGCKPRVALGITLHLKVRGVGIERTTYDTHYAPAVAMCCERRIGTLETQMSTVFGIAEDERVLSGAWKVY